MSYFVEGKEYHSNGLLKTKNSWIQLIERDLWLCAYCLATQKYKKGETEETVNFIHKKNCRWKTGEPTA